MENKQETTIHGCFLDTHSLGKGLNWRLLEHSINQWDMYPQTPAKQVAARIKNAQVVVSNKAILDETALSQAKNLELVCIAATGTNNIDLEAAKKYGVTVTNVTGYAGHAVPQHVFALMLAHATRWPSYAQDVKQGRWQKSDFFCRLDYPIAELAGAHLGLIGYGNLGQNVAQIARAFGMHVLVAERAEAKTIRPGRLALDQVLAQADFISLHCPLTEHTHHLLNAQRLKQLKPNAYIINTARGGIIDSQALIDALKQKRIAGAALDVLPQEPPNDNEPLLANDIPNLTITPHCAWGSLSARQRILDTVTQQINDFFNS